MRHLITGSLTLLAAVALLATGCDNRGRAPEEWTAPNAGPGMSRYNLAEVVATAERSDWVMPEVVVSANLMPEVVVSASRVPAPVALSAPSLAPLLNY